MISVDTIGRVRHAFHVKGKKIKQISREFRLARNTVRRILRGEATEHCYARTVQPVPKLGGFSDLLIEMLVDNAKRQKRERATFQRMFEDLRLAGYRGGYDALRRFARAWQIEQASKDVDAYIPLVFDPGEAYQFDWSHEIVEIDGVRTTAKVAHVRLCYSRMPFIRAYPRETQEMVFDAHDKAFQFFKGTCQRGIYDNMKTAVDAVFVGKERHFNRRFQQMLSHHLVEPTACTPGAGWEKGQVENQVGVLRRRLFVPRLRFKSWDDMGAYLLDQCVSFARSHPHPDKTDKSIFEIFETERAALIGYRGPFDGYRSTSASVSKTCLVRFDNNKYSVKAGAVGRPVDIFAHADRIVFKQDGVVVGEHARCYRRGGVFYDPWHYVPVLSRKPGALRNGAPFKDWLLPRAITAVRSKLSGSDDGDRQMVKILAAVLSDGLNAVEAACAESLEAGIASADVILNALARQQQPEKPEPIMTPERLALATPPVADCARYDCLRSPRVTSSELSGSAPSSSSEAAGGIS